MTHAHNHRILTINSGSSSVKVAVFLMGTKETRTLVGHIERIGLRGGHFQIKDGDGQVLVEKHAELPDHATALKILGLDHKEALPLLDLLLEHATQSRFIYRHRWEPGDLVMWDNRCMLHKANGDYDMNEMRYLYRVMLKGDVPM